VISYNFLKLRS